MSYASHLRCRECGRHYPLEPIHVCEFCFGPLEAAYDYAALSRTISRQGIEKGPLTVWRYSDLLPCDREQAVDIGAGFTPLLRAQNLGSPVLFITMMLVLLNISYVVFSIPAGVLSDRLGRRRVIALGWLVYSLIYLGFATASNLWQIWLLFAAYGVYYGVVEGVARAFVADLIPEEKRGTAYGLYHGVVGLTLLPASLLAGWLWQAYSPAAPFYFGAGLAFVAMLGLMVFIRE